MNAENVFPGFLLNAINQQLSVFIQKAHGGVGLSHITKKEIDLIKIPLPSLDAQKQISFILNENLTKADYLQKLLQYELDTINTLPDSILRQAFSGGL